LTFVVMPVKVAADPAIAEPSSVLLKHWTPNAPAPLPCTAPLLVMLTDVLLLAWMPWLVALMIEAVSRTRSVDPDWTSAPAVVPVAGTAPAGEPRTSRIRPSNTGIAGPVVALIAASATKMLEPSKAKMRPVFGPAPPLPDIVLTVVGTPKPESPTSA